MLSRTRLGRAMLAAGLLIGVASTPVAAATTVGVSGCYFRGGVEHIAPDSVTIQTAWGAKTRGQIVAFLTSNTWHLTVDGVAIDVTQYMGEPALRDDGFWWVTVLYPAGELELGDELQVVVEYDLAHPVYDGFDLFRGIIGPLDCTIIADLT